MSEPTMACALCGSTLRTGDRLCGGCGADIDTASGGHGAVESPAASALRDCLAALHGRREDVYVNPKGVVVVPYRTTSTFIDAEATRDGRVCVSVQAVVLRDIPPHPGLFRYVALNGGKYLVGGLLLYETGDALDLDTVARRWRDGLTPDELLDAVDTVARNAVELADVLEPQYGGMRLNPSGRRQKKLWNQETLAARRDVADALVARLDTQSTAIMGAADHATFMHVDGRRDELTAPVYAVTVGGLWVGGRDPYRGEPVVWHVAHRRIARDVMHHEQAPYDYFALLDDQSGVMVQVDSQAEAHALLVARNEAA